MKTTGFTAIAILIIIVVISGLCWQYSINEWLAYFKKDTMVQLWQAVILGAIPGIGQLALPIAAFTWIIMMFI